MACMSGLPTPPLRGQLPSPEFWNGRRVLVTGHTGFKGSWLSLWLHDLGAQVTGYALTPPSTPNLFTVARIADGMESDRRGDVRDAEALKSVVAEIKPDVVFHLAAQPLVLQSYADPVETFAVNVMGTVNLLEAVRGHACAVVNVTTDKCYDNQGWLWGYRENEPLGGHDPYSSSKACAELVTAAYRQSFFAAAGSAHNGVAVATARAGNVVGGGDWAENRLIPDSIRSFEQGIPVELRHPNAVRPWQHVLEPLCGYLLLAEKLATIGSDFAEAWNFGPADSNAEPVWRVVERLVRYWGDESRWIMEEQPRPHEAPHLKLDSSKAGARLGWIPRWSLDRTLEETVAWHRSFRAGSDMRDVMRRQIGMYTTDDGA